MLRLPPFRYHQPRSAEEAVRITADHGPAAMYVAGGTDLYPNMKRRVQTPTEVVSLAAVEELHSLSQGEDGGTTIGAMARLAELEDDEQLRAEHPALAAAIGEISTPLLRNMGTIGGNLLLDTRCNYYNQSHEWREAIHFCMKCEGETCWVAPSSPRCWAVQSSDTVPLLCAMGAEVSLLGPDGARRIPIEQLYVDDGIAFTSRRPGELLTELHLPAPNGWRAHYQKLRRRDSFDFPVLGVGVWVRQAGDGTLEDIRIRIGGAGSHPIAATATEDMLRGQRPDQELLRAASQEAFKPTLAMDNTDHEAAWRKKIAPVFVRRAVEACLG